MPVAPKNGTFFKFDGEKTNTIRLEIIQINEVKKKKKRASYLRLKLSGGPQTALVPLTFHRVMSRGSSGPTSTF